MQRICSTLTANGYDVLLVGRKCKDFKEPVPKLYGQRQLKCRFSKGKLFYIEYNIRLFLYLMVQEWDIVSSVDTDSLGPAFLTSVLRSKVIVFDAHEYFTEVPEVTDRKIVKSIWAFLEKICLPKIKFKYTVSESIADIYSKKFGHFEVIRNTPVLLENSFKINPEKYIIYQGALNEGRGLEELILAMKEINCVLKIAGEGDLSEDLRNLVHENNLSDKIKFLGKLDPVELKELTASAYIGINILKNKGLSYYYSLANKFFDYMHAGVPSVTADFPEYQKINKQFEVAVLTDLNVQRIVNSIKKLMEDEVFYKHLRDNCKEARKHYNWQKEEQMLLKIYASAAQ